MFENDDSTSWADVGPHLSAKAPLYVLSMVAEKKLTPTNLFVYLTIRGLAGRGYCTASFVAEIAGRTGMEKRAVRRHLKALREVGVIEVRSDYDENGRTWSVYVFHDAADCARACAP